MIVALRAAVVTLVLTGIAYPLAVTGAALALFPQRARGSLVLDEKGAAVGSELIAQRFESDGYLWPRPSANGYDGTNSGGSNLGPTSKALRERGLAELQRLERRNSGARGPVPPELFMTSASGLDPHLSPQAALWQAPRVARARGVAEERVRAVIDRNVEGRDLGVFGEPRVNVLLVNLALDRLLGRPPL